ncbi:MAG: ABC transporter permease [Defluviitaleaceae bacterium]|nr:ABC transporter permease [Defluviitaleaceae bacterium]
MKINIFLKSVLRQPIRTFVLSLLIAAASFALVARVTEYIVVSNEIKRIEGYYRSIGILSPLYFNDFTGYHDVRRAAELIEGSRHVSISDTRRFTQGVMADRLNIVTQSNVNFFHPTLHGLDMELMDHYFVGYLMMEPRFTRSGGVPMLWVGINVVELVLGDPRSLISGDRTFVNERGQVATVQSRQHMYLTLTEEEGELYERGLWSPFDGLRIAEHALFRATAADMDRGDWGTVWGHFIWYLLPFNEDRVFYSSPTDVDIIENFEMHSQNLSSVTVIDTKDMTAIPRFTNNRTTRLLDTMLYPAGRWLTHEDYLTGNRVAVVSAQLAIRRNLHVGETFTITLRDNPRPNWIDRSVVDPDPWASGIEHWWDNHPAGWWSMIDSTHDNWRDFPTYELELEVVGVFWNIPHFIHNFTSTEIFIPAGLMPEGFGWDDAPLLSAMYSFVLDSPRSERLFIRENRAALADLGFALLFLPNGFEALAAATDPIRTSITVNLGIFTGVSVLVMLLVIFLYIRQWRRNVAIAKALGVPSSRVLAQLFTPVIYIWIPAVIVGSVVGWSFALGEAEATLGGFAEQYEVYTEALIGTVWLAVMVGAISLTIFTGIYLAGFSLVRRPVLEQLQGNVQRRRREKVIESGIVPENFTVEGISIPQEPLTKTRIGVMYSVLRHGYRHIVRSPVKTGLAFIVAMLFVLSLAWLNDTIYFTESEVERLWNETVITAEIVRIIDPFDIDEVNLPWQAHIAPSSWDSVLATGFVTESYREALSVGHSQYLLGISHLEGFIEENTKTPLDEQLGIFCDDIVIEYSPGFGAEDFVFTPDMPTPIFVQRSYLEDFEVTIGETITFMVYDINNILQVNYATIIGAFDGGLRRGVNRFDLHVFVMPISALYHHAQGLWLFDEGNTEWGMFGMQTGRPTYLTARFVSDPTRNRELAQLRELTEIVLAQNNLGRYVGPVPLEMLLDDDVIENVIQPMERNLSLLRVLYPIAIGSAFVLALGLSLLIMMQNAKNAAIMRVLGKAKGASRAALCLEQLVVCLIGVIMGFAAMLLVGVTFGVTPLALAGVYFAGAAVGSLVGAFVISAKSPMELLQVRE